MKFKQFLIEKLIEIPYDFEATSSKGTKIKFIKGMKVYVDTDPRVNYDIIIKTNNGIVIVKFDNKIEAIKSGWKI